MVEEKGGWFVKNVKDARWVGTPAFGARCVFEGEEPFPEVGVGISLLEPGKPLCRYHRESAQEDFLVLSGECLLLINGEKRQLKAWDFVHCPPGVTHVLVGAGDGPCAVLCIGARHANKALHYPKSDFARPYNAETPQPTDDPRVAYADVEPRVDIDPPEWPLR